MAGNWRETTLGHVCDEVSGLIQTGPFGSQLHESDYSSEGVPVVMPKDIVEGRIVTDSIARVSPDHVARLSRHKLRTGDVVYGRRGDIGRQALIRPGQDGWMCGTGCLRISLGDTVVDPQFLHYYLRQPSVIEWIANQAVGATMPNLNTSILRKVPVRFPALRVQRNIAGILSAYDELIENNQRRVAILDSMARGLHHEWFVHFRFRGHESATRGSSPLGDIPLGWRVGRLETICEQITSGGTPRTSASEYWGGGIPWLSSGETGNAYIIETDKTITAGGVSNSSTRFARVGCTVVASAGQGKTRGQTSMLCLGTYINQSTIALTADAKQISDNFLFMELARRYAQLRQISDGSSRGSLTTRLLADLEVIVPPANVVHEFDALVAPLVKSIEIGLRKNRNLRRTRDLILPRLLSGQIEVEALAS
jgi:type I restriction enzyme S subunit